MLFKDEVWGELYIKFSEMEGSAGMEEKESSIDEQMKIPTMLPIVQLSQRTGLSYDYIRKLCIQHKIVFVRAGNKYLINLEKFIEFLNNGEMN